MLKLSQKKRKALLALAVAAAVLGANNAFAASVHETNMAALCVHIGKKQVCIMPKHTPTPLMRM